MSTVFVVESDDIEYDRTILGVAGDLPVAKRIAQAEGDTYETGDLEWTQAEDGNVWTAGTAEITLTITETEVQI